ncbi:MAG: CBS domain-containing protein [Anaerolineae bacterium]
MDETTVMQAKRLGVYTCRQDTTLLAAARRMADEDISALVAVDGDGYLAGIITRTDLIRAYRTCPDWPTRCVEEFMNADVITVGPHALLAQVADLLLKKHIHRVVVVRQEGDRKRPLAVVSSTDLVYHMVKETE